MIDLDTALINTRIEESQLTNGEWAVLIGVYRTTWMKYRKNWGVMPVEKFVQLCLICNIPLEIVVRHNTSVSVGYDTGGRDLREKNVLTWREKEMVLKDWQQGKSEIEICKYYNTTIRYLRELRKGM